MDRLSHADVTRSLGRAGCVAAADEATELIGAASDGAELSDFLSRRVTGEPLAWITGRVSFCGVEIRMHRDVYVPRWQSEAVAAAAVHALPADGVAVDLCCGSGAVAAVLSRKRPRARVLATDADARAVACALENGVEAAAGDLFAPLPVEVRGTVDVIVAVAPYVPTAELALVGRSGEPVLALDGGPDGLAVVSRIAAAAPAWLCRSGTLVLELGEPQVTAVSARLAAAGFDGIDVLCDPDGDVCGVVARHANTPHIL